MDGTFSKAEFEDRRAKYQAELEDLERRVAYLDRHEEKQPKLVVDHARIQTNISNVIDAYKRLNSKT
ncbi:hypothetical protein EL26_00675 [Tumebacillus flagellatus]|uniref:Uncharacterized protein n=1 Tax=Tumebacillus flagellatus TaxID=1157490 RepID=A0A074LW83_9BACL|nr:hypothetical protein EL26_00675 [Tumebacillus flagellatus]